MAGYFYNGKTYLQITSDAIKQVVNRYEATLCHTYESVIRTFCNWPKMNNEFPKGYRFVQGNGEIDVSDFIVFLKKYAPIYDKSPYIYSRCLNFFIEERISRNGTFIYGDVSPFSDVFTESKESDDSFIMEDVIYLSSDSEFFYFITNAGNLDNVKTLHCKTIEIG